MPPKKGNGKQKVVGTTQSQKGKKKKTHVDPLDALVKEIEAVSAPTNRTAAKPQQPQQPPASSPKASVEQVTDAKEDGGADASRQQGKNYAKNKKKNNKKRGQEPVKVGMTKAQKREAYLAAREKKHGQPIPLPDDAEEEDEEPHNNSNEDYSDTQNERAKEYRKGGYHPVVVGDVYNDRYRVIKKLGWGYFSTVWLVWDYVTKSYQAMKIQKSAEHYREAAFDEIRLLSEIMDADSRRDRCCARMNDYFEHVGPNGTHVCMVFDVLGENLLNLMEWYEYRGIPIPIVKAIAQQVLIGLEHIHAIEILHTDLKPENVLLSAPKHKIVSIMKHYSPPPLHKRPSLLTKDVKSMTKSQKKRYYQKLKKSMDGGATQAEAEELLANADTASAGTGGGAGDDGQSSQAGGSVEPNTSGAAPPSDEAQRSERKKDEFGVILEQEMSDTDPEWEIERFHHVCLADFGNSCWTYKQFTDEVQTRQYRSPEVILGNGYSTPIDLWSAACMIFELLTGEFLFDPKQGDNYTRDEDHLALMTELLGELPESMRLGNGKFRSQFYTSKGELRHIKQLNFWGLPEILHEKYRFTKKKAAEIAEFLLPMLALDPAERATATEMLNAFQHFFEVQEDDYEPLCRVPPEDRQVDRDESTASVASDDHADDEDNLDDGAEDSDEEDGAGGDAGQHRASSADEAELREWWRNHPLLNEEALQARGLTIRDIQLALANQPTDDPSKSAEIESLLMELDQMELAAEPEEENDA